MINLNDFVDFKPFTSSSHLFRRKWHQDTPWTKETVHHWSDTAVLKSSMRFVRTNIWRQSRMTNMRSHSLRRRMKKSRKLWKWYDNMFSCFYRSIVSLLLLNWRSLSQIFYTMNRWIYVRHLFQSFRIHLRGAFTRRVSTWNAIGFVKNVHVFNC